MIASEDYYEEHQFVLEWGDEGHRMAGACTRWVQDHLPANCR
jgi:hypothetical protein